MAESEVLNKIIPVGAPAIAVICAVVDRGSSTPLLVLSSSNTEFLFTVAGLVPILTWARRVMKPAVRIVINKKGVR